MTGPRAKVEEIALYLGAPWKFNRLGAPSDWRFEIIDGAGRGLFFRLDKDKFRISGAFPRNRTSLYHTQIPRIGVSHSRPAKAIAADIQRRLIPAYLKSYAAAAEKYQAEQEQERQLDIIAEMIRKASNGRCINERNSDRRIYFDKGEARFWNDQKIHLTLRDLSVEQAVKILAGLK